MAKAFEKRIVRRKQALNAEVIKASLIDPNPYAGMTKAEAFAMDLANAQHSAEQTRTAVAAFQKRLRARKVEVRDAVAATYLYAQLGPLLQNMFSTVTEGTDAGLLTLTAHAGATQEAVLDTAAANVAYLAKPALAKIRNAAKLRQRIIDAIPAAKAEEQERAQRTKTRVLVKNVNSNIARMAACKLSVVEKTRKATGL